MNGRNVSCHRCSALLVLALSACTGTIDGKPGSPAETTDPHDPAAPRPGSPTPTPTPTPSPTAPVGSTGPLQVGRTPMRRLTKVEYANTVRDLFGSPNAAAVTTGFAPDVMGANGYTSGSPIGTVEATQYLEAALKLAALPLPSLCDAGTAEAVCADQSIRRFGGRAYRRPLLEEEAADLKAVFQAARTDGGDFRRAFQTVVASMLQSPNFLYRVDVGLRDRAKDGVAPLDAFEIASRLSYFLWQSMPDDALLDAARSGALYRPETLRDHTLRLLKDARARDAIASFGADWLNLGIQDITKSSSYPKFTSGVKASMDRETTTFITNQILAENADVGSLFSARHTWVDTALATAYGLPAVPSGAWEKRQYPDASLRSGLLTHIALLARNASYAATSPTRRGLLVRERLFCQSVPPPPNDLNPTPPVPRVDFTVREQMEQHVSDPSCAGCHAVFDPIGFAFESFDPIGLERTAELMGKAVDPTGKLIGTDVDGPITSVRDLGGRMAKSDVARRCVAQQLFRFALGRGEGTDQQSFDRAYDVLAKNGFRFQELMVALATSPAFLNTPVN